MSDEMKIKCPKCGHEFMVGEAFEHQVEEKIQKQYEEKNAQAAEKVNKRLAELQKEKEALQKQKDEQDEIVKAKLEAEKKKLTETAEKKVKGEFEEKLILLQKENEQRKLENINYKKKEVELLQKENELKEERENLKLEMEKQMFEKRKEIEEKIIKTEHEKTELKFRDYEQKLDDQKKLIDALKQKSEQGSMEREGESLEKAIEEWLTDNFLFDKIVPIKKGERGADVLQLVNEPPHMDIGKIYYESKRTKDFQAGWIEKFKKDMREKSADMGILVTQAMPKDMDRMGMKEGIWICSYEEFKALSFVMRDSLIKIKSAMASQENKGDKMSMLYDYLTGVEFRAHIEGIVEGFVQMKDDLEREKRSMESTWKKREKQLEKVTKNSIYMYSSIKGIAGKEIGSIKALELTEGEETMNNEQ